MPPNPGAWSALYVQGLKDQVEVMIHGDEVCPVRAGVEGEIGFPKPQPLSLPCTCRG